MIADSLTSIANRLDVPRHYMGMGANIAQADAAYLDSAWYGKILTIPVDDAFREWRAWQADTDIVEMIEAEEKRLGYPGAAHEAAINARHQGGSVIVPLGLPGSNSQPLRLDSIRKGAITRLVVLGREEITAGPLARNPLSDGYGRPEYWEIGGVRLHPSRVVLINGRTPPGSAIRRGEIWGQPIWGHLARSIMAADGAAEVVADLLSEAKLDIVTIPGMVDMLMSADGEEAFMRRWSAVARLKASGNVMLIDGGPSAEGTKSEAWDQKQITWGGLPETVKTLLMVMAGAADIPMTRLTGEQQTGLSGSDAGSLRHYYDMVGAEQRLRIQPALSPLDEMLIRSALGYRPDDLWYRWNSLYQMDEKTSAEVDKLQAETSAIYAINALVPTAALEASTQARMVETGRWPGLEAALADAPEDEPEDDLDVIGEGPDAENPPA